MQKKNYDTAVVIGRFQLFHNGHLSLLREALAVCKSLVVVLGSSFGARTPKNPFTAAEREKIIRLCLTPEENARVVFCGVRDYYRDERWAQAVRTAVAPHICKDSTALVGHYKDRSSYYLNLFPEWEQVEIPQQGAIDATALRNIYFEGGASPGSLAVLATRVPCETLSYLQGFSHLPEYANMVREHHGNLKEISKWAGAPHVPTICTADALLKAAGKVLLIRRVGGLGSGLLAIPGGHIEPNEQFIESAIRELREETHCGLLESTLLRSLRASELFDHPGRSLRGRVISVAFFFDMGDMSLGELSGNPGESEPLLVDVEDLPGLEDQFFDDHFHILDHFLNLTA